jgi:membrane-bound serine protease (ClpP class)
LLFVFLIQFCCNITGASASVFVISINGSINPGSAIYLDSAIEQAEKSNASCLVLELDTPGGLVSSLRHMVKAILGANMPIIVYVYPSGAQAASAGALLTMASDIAVMAPGTNIGAAHPVGLAGNDDSNSTISVKVENDLAAMARSLAQSKGRNVEWAERAVRDSVSITASEALSSGVIDIVASGLSELLVKINGRKVMKNGKEYTLVVKDVDVKYIEPGFRDSFLMILADPNIAYILMMIGMAGLYFELSHPGAIFPGVIGGISLLLSLFAMQTLPVNITAVLLIVFAMILFVLELFVTSHGVLGVSGVISLVIGSLMLFDADSTGVAVDPSVLVPVLCLTGGFMIFLAWLAAKASVRGPVSGAEGMVNEKGMARTTVDKTGGLVLVHGEIWKAISSDVIPEGTAVVVKEIQGMKLMVQPVEKKEENDAC